MVVIVTQPRWVVWQVAPTCATSLLGPEFQGPSTDPVLFWNLSARVLIRGYGHHASALAEDRNFSL